MNNGTQNDIHGGACYDVSSHRENTGNILGLERLAPSN